jgi:putative Mg2+ transporter-C (MgtC) family protein
MEVVSEMDWYLIWSHFYHLIIAFILAVPLGWDREHGSHSGAGLRTFPLVAVGSCAYMLTGINVLNSTEAQGRVIYGILTGIGFIGGGAILKERGNVAGTATAASIWNTGAIGIAVAWNRYEIALVLSALNFLTFRFMPLLKRRINSSQTTSDPKIES